VDEGGAAITGDEPAAIDEATVTAGSPPAAAMAPDRDPDPNQPAALADSPDRAVLR
jgi:hypothetical protein